MAGPTVNRGRRVDARAENCLKEARAAVERGKKLAAEGKEREAMKALAEAERHYALYKKYGGKENG